MPVWNDAVNLAEEIFQLSEKFFKKEDYGFTSQLRRTSLSKYANVAEGYGRHHTLDKINFYYFSGGSVTETQNHIEYGKRIGYLGTRRVLKICHRSILMICQWLIRGC